MNTESIQYVSSTANSYVNPSKSDTYSDSDSNGFMSVISDIISQSNENQLSDALQLLDIEQDTQSDVCAELAALLAQYNLSLSSDNQLINTDASNTNITDESSVSSILSSLTNQPTLNSYDILNMSDSQGSQDNSQSNILSVMSSLLSSTNPNDAIGDISSIPLDALYELAKINAEKKDIAAESDFASLSTDDKIQVLKEAITDGKITVTKDTDIFSAINQIKSNYNFSQSISQAKKSLLEQPDTSENSQSAVIFDYNQDAVVDLQSLKLNGTTDENAIFNQTLDSIEKAVEQQIEKFTVKLNPNGLGEVVINLEKSEAGMVVNIIAENARTAELLNNQLGSIQANLSQHNAQINPATVVETQQSASYDLNQQMLEQQFSQQQKNGSNYRSSHSLYDSDDSSETQSNSIQVANSILNTYA